jgi:hypothetical protein
LISRFTVASVVVFALLIVTARAIGSTNKPPALALLDPGDCPQPCWQGIRPGVTTFVQAKAILQADPVLSLRQQDTITICWQKRRGQAHWGCISSDRVGRVARITVFLPEKAVQLGETLDLLGVPKYVLPCQFIGRSQVISDPGIVMSMAFGANIWATLYKYSEHENLRMEPSMFISTLTYDAPANGNRGWDSIWKAWRGFNNCWY